MLDIVHHEEDGLEGIGVSSENDIMESGGINIVLNLAEFSEDGDLSDNHFGVIIIFHEAFDVFDGEDLFGVSVLCAVHLSVGSGADEFFDSVVFCDVFQVVHVVFVLF